jgi:hypothetical protein
MNASHPRTFAILFHAHLGSNEAKIIARYDCSARQLRSYAEMATSIPLSTLQPATPTAPTGPTCQTASNPSSAAGSGTAPGGLASVTRASNLITPNAAVSPSTAQTLAGPATAQPASTPVAGSKVRRWLKRLFDSLRMVASRCRCSKAVQRLLHICPKTWKGIFTLAGSVVTFILTIYYGVVQYNAAQVSNTIAKKALLYTAWTANKDFREACASDVDSGRPISAACNEALASPTQPPPTLTKRTLDRAWVPIFLSSIPREWALLAIAYAWFEFFNSHMERGTMFCCRVVILSPGIWTMLDVSLFYIFGDRYKWFIMDARHRDLLVSTALFTVFSAFTLWIGVLMMLNSPKKTRKYKDL